MVAILIILCAVLAFVLYQNQKLKTQHTEKILLDTKTLEQNKEIERTNAALKEEQKHLTTEIGKSTEAFNQLRDTIKTTQDTLVETAKAQAKEEIQIFTNHLNVEYYEVLADLAETAKQKLKEIEISNAELAEIRRKEQAYHDEQKRKEEMSAKKDWYRLNISAQDHTDILTLRDLQIKLYRKEAIDKLIWDVYIKTAYDTLMSHFFNGTEKKCGIYKITSLVDERAYVGQSVDIRTRWRDHIKAGLAFAPASNKLYQAMQAQGVDNFTFEILEEVSKDKLNEREKYYIEFFNTKEWGYNSNAGGSKSQ